MRHIRGRLILTVAFTLLSVLLLVPTLVGEKNLPEWWKSVLPAKRLSLGLDLKGGVHLVFEVESDKAVEVELKHIADNVRRGLEDEGAVVDRVEAVPGAPDRHDDDRVRVHFAAADGKPTLEKLVKKNKGWALSVDSAASTDTEVVLSPDPKVLDRRRDEAIEQAIEVIRNRIDQYGVGEPTIQRQGEERVLVQLAGVENPAEAKALIQNTALLEFKLIDSKAENDLKESLAGLKFGDLTEDNAKKDAEAKVNAALAAKLPVGSTWLFEVKRDKITRKIVQAYPRIVKKETLLSGAFLSDARVDFGQLHNPQVALRFDSEGARRFADITGEHAREFLAIVLDNTIYSAPVIRQRISGGNAVIEGGFDSREAHNLAIVLRAGSLPAPLVLLEERTVGPELGQKSVQDGKIATLVSTAAVMLFMVIYYRRGGMLANVALMLNLVFLMAGLAAFRATLTLPGIAGIALTLAMDVDANIIILERIREELRAGKTPRSAMEAGYDRAFSAIFDSKLTTLIAGLILYQFGTGPVRGFAVTLSLGLVIGMFTALVFTRMVYDYVFATRRVTTLSV